MKQISEAIFALETVAHLQGLERDLLPHADAARAALESVENLAAAASNVTIMLELFVDDLRAKERADGAYRGSNEGQSRLDNLREAIARVRG